MIPHKLFSRLTDSLMDHRNHPGPETDRVLLADEEECGWPWNASIEQLQEWDAICERTRPTFEAAVRALRTPDPRLAGGAPTQEGEYPCTTRS